jgi:hypothetical protein
LEYFVPICYIIDHWVHWYIALIKIWQHCRSCFASETSRFRRSPKISNAAPLCVM